MTITDEQIKTLQDEAEKAGDALQVTMCLAALDGDEDSRAECNRVVSEAREWHNRFRIEINEEHIGTEATREEAWRLIEKLEALGWNVAYGTRSWKFDSDEQRADFDEAFEDLATSMEETEITT